MKNPFEFGRPVGEIELVDRQNELRAVKSALTQGQKLWLIGPRRYGKTSILVTAQEQLRARNAIVLRFNLEEFATPDALARAIVVGAARASSGSASQIAQGIAKVFSRLKPSLSVDPLGGTFSASLELSPAEKADPALLGEALRGLEELAANSEASWGVAFDEFQKILDWDASLEAQLRAVVQEHRRVGYVFAGSKTRILSDMVSDAARPFYRLGDWLWLGELPRPEFEQFLRDGFAQLDIEIENAALAAILDLSQQVPYNVQQLARACWELARDAQRLDVALIEESFGAILRRNDAVYTASWSVLTAIQKRTLRAIIEFDGQNMTGIAATARIGRPANSVKTRARIDDRPRHFARESSRRTIAISPRRPIFWRLDRTIYAAALTFISRWQ